MSTFFSEIRQQVRTLSSLWVTIFVVLLAIFSFTSFHLGKKFTSSHAPHSATSQDPSSQEKKIAFWTCSMHPEVQLNRPGKCPKCFMDLIPVYQEDEQQQAENAKEVSLTLSPSARKLAEIATTPVSYRELTHELSLIGKIDYDETRVVNISLWTPGKSRLEKMFVAFTGAKVNKGDPLVEVYSPDLIAAQGEYLAAYRSSQHQANNGSYQSSFASNIQAARRKLLDLGMTKEQVTQLEKRGTPEETTVIHAPVGGTVISKLVNEGEWHDRGMALYKIADLSQVWVKIDAYESDLIWIRYAQKVQFTAEAYPGRKFEGRISFIDPFLQENTRTVKLRVNANNEQQLLKPGMFVRAKIYAQVAQEGKIVDDELAGKWICPVHPSSISSQPGKCPVSTRAHQQQTCQRKLVAAAELGYIEQTGENQVLAIPETAPLITGKRAVVYVESRDKRLSYQGREVFLGPKAGEYYVVLSGLEQGELVVTQGAFKLDSALQIRAKASMMNPQQEKQQEKDKKQQQEEEKQPERAPFAVTSHPYHQQMREFLDAYFHLTQALAEDKKKHLGHYLQSAQTALQSVTWENLPPASEQRLQHHLQQLQQVLSTIAQPANLANVREQLQPLSQAVSEYLQDFGHPYREAVYQMSCPMANEDQGGMWWQSSDELRNPYFGSQMLYCGADEGKLAPLPKGFIGREAQHKMDSSEMDSSGDHDHHHHPNENKKE